MLIAGVLKQLADVVLGSEDSAERHRDDGVLAHDGLVDELVREDVFTGRIVDDDRRVADDGREVVEADGVHALSAADADRSEIAGAVAANDAVDVLPALECGANGLRIGLCAAALVRNLGGFAHTVYPQLFIRLAKPIPRTADAASARSRHRRHGRRRKDNPYPVPGHALRTPARTRERG